MSAVEDAVVVVLERISRAAKRVHRDVSDVTLVAVSKRHSVTSMRAFEKVAQRSSVPVVFGENYVQELKVKYPEFSGGAEFHLIGPLQSNKIRDAVRYSDVIESVHSLQVLEGIAVEARKQNKCQAIFLQVNIGEDPNKSGFSEGDIFSACDLTSVYADSISLRGLMTITPYYSVPEDARPDFRKMNELRHVLVQAQKDLYFDSHTILLSMGMSSDYEIAIEEGADIVRVGTAIFGER